jgi:hypothetical protein
LARLRLEQVKVRDQIEGYNRYYRGLGLFDMID